MLEKGLNDVMKKKCEVVSSRIDLIMRNNLKWSSIFVEGYVKDFFFKLEKERDCWMKDVKEEAFFFLSLLSPIIAITTLFIYEYFYLKTLNIIIIMKSNIPTNELSQSNATFFKKPFRMMPCPLLSALPNISPKSFILPTLEILTY